MRLVRATGLVMRTRPLTDTSLIVQWLTRDLGRVATVAKGARRPKSPFRGQIDLFYLAELSFVRSSRSDLHTLREVRLLEAHAALRSDLAYVRQASYCAGLVEQATEPETPIPVIFDMFLGMLQQLVLRPAQPQTIFGFEMKLLRELGLAPPLAQTRLTAGSRQILEHLAQAEWPDIFRLGLSAPQVSEIRQYLHGFLIYHLGKVPRGKPFA